MAKQQFFEFARIYIFAAADDHVLQATLDGAIAASIHRAEISSMQPALGIDRRGGRLRHFEIAEHDVVAARAELADFADRGGLAGILIDDRSVVANDGCSNIATSIVGTAIIAFP